MPIYTDVVASRIEKYRAQLERDGSNDADIDGAIFRYVFCQLVDAAFGGGGGGGGSTSSATIAAGINSSSDIDTIVTRLTSIDTNQLNQTTVRSAIDSSVDIDTLITRLTSIDTKTIAESNIVSAIQTAADIDTLIARLLSIDNKTPAVGAATITGSTPVNIASDQIVPIDNSRIAGNSISVGTGAIDTGTQRIAIADNSRISGYGFASSATITRAANTTAYTANDVYAGAFELPTIGLANSSIILSGIRIVFNIAALPSGMGGMLLYLYSATPPSAVADNGAFSVPSGDRTTILTPGGIDIGSAIAAVGGGTVVLQSDNLNIQLPIGATGSLWGYLVTKTAFTPAAVSQTAVITAVTLGV